jgi:hypothetical protein
MASKNETVAARIAKDKAAVLEYLRATPIVQLAVKQANVGRTTYYSWRKQDAKFAKAADEAAQAGVLMLNDVAEAQLLSLIKDKKFEAIRFWLAHRHPAYAAKLELQGSITHERRELTPAEKKLVRQALRLAKLRAYGTGQEARPGGDQAPR